MPTPAVHLAYAGEYLKHRPELDGSAFLRGTIFPDIRYMAGFDRGRTHRPFEVGLDEVEAESNAWQAGFLFHNWLDDEWNRYFMHYGMDYYDSTQTPMWSALKLLEERMLLKHAGDAVGSTRVLEVADPEAVAFGVAPEVVKRWGYYVGTVLVSEWMDETWDEYAVKALGQTSDGLADWRRRIAKLEAEGIWEERLEGCWDSVTGLLGAERRVA